MGKRTVAIAICLAGTALGLGGCLFLASLPILGALGFSSFLATIFLLAVGPDRSWSRADDVRRAHEHEEHPMPEGPAPPFQS